MYHEIPIALMKLLGASPLPPQTNPQSTGLVLPVLKLATLYCSQIKITM